MNTIEVQAVLKVEYYFFFQNVSDPKTMMLVCRIPLQKVGLVGLVIICYTILIKNIAQLGLKILGVVVLILVALDILLRKNVFPHNHSEYVHTQMKPNVSTTVSNIQLLN